MEIAYIMMAVAIFGIVACVVAYFDARASRKNRPTVNGER
jgi:heme/copper-type cytochrome/quinol oxidase subunit 2